MNLDQLARNYLFQHSRLLALRLNNKLRIVEANPGTLNTLGVPPEELVGKSLYELVIADDDEMVDRVTAASQIEGEIVRMRSSNDREVSVLMSLYRAPDGVLVFGEAVGDSDPRRKDLTLELHKRSFSLAKTIEELRNRNENLETVNQWMREKSVVDPTTGLYKRNQLDRLLRTEWERAKRHLGELSFLLISIDGLQPFRELQGADAASLIFRGVARVLETRKRLFDVLGHFDDETLFLLLPHTPLDGARELADRLRRLLENREFRAGDYPFRILLSLGLAAYHHRFYPLRSHDELIHLAADAIAEARIDGGNQVRCTQVPVLTPPVPNGAAVQ
ncbi:MAG: GGDEF domain-containing protein [Myxococcales bacterium]|nr:GGDEF domain-containing protein [Myxococcales bacterium]